MLDRVKQSVSVDFVKVGIVFSTRADMRIYTMVHDKRVQSLFASGLSIYVQSRICTQLICLGFNSQNYDLNASKKDLLQLSITICVFLLVMGQFWNIFKVEILSKREYL